MHFRSSGVTTDIESRVVSVIRARMRVDFDGTRDSYNNLRCDTQDTTSLSPSPRKCVLPQSVLTHTNAHTTLSHIHTDTHYFIVFSVCVASQGELS